MTAKSTLKAPFHFSKQSLKQMAIVSLLVLLTSACVTTGGGVKKDNTRIARKNCSANITAADQQTNQANSADSVASDCLPLGVIEIYESAPVDAEIREEFNQAVALVNKENYSEAIKLLKGVTGKTSKFSAPFINIGIAYARTGDFDKAKDNFKKALEISPQHPVAHNELALVYRKTGKYAEARKLYEDLLAIYPDFLPARKNLGVLCDIYIQDLDCALHQYEEYLIGKPNDEKVTIWIADIKSRM